VLSDVSSLGARAEEKRRERLVVVVRDAVLRQAGNLTVPIKAGRWHVAEQFVDDAYFLLSPLAQDLLAPGAGDAQGQRRLAVAAAGIFGEVI